MPFVETGNHITAKENCAPMMAGGGSLRMKIPDGREVVSKPDQSPIFPLVDYANLIRQGDLSCPVSLDLNLTTYMGEDTQYKPARMVFEPSLVSDEELKELDKNAWMLIQTYEQLKRGGATQEELLMARMNSEEAAKLLLAATGWNGQFDMTELTDQRSPLDDTPVGIRARSGRIADKPEKAIKTAETFTRIAAGVTIGLTVGAAIDNAILTENEVAREVTPSNAIQRKLDVSMLMDSNVSAEITGFSTNIDLSESGKDGVSPFVEQSVGKILAFFADKANAQEGQSQTIWVRAEKGDTASSLAFRCRTTVAAIEAANNWELGSASWRFQAGKLVKVPCKSDILNYNPRAGSNSKVAVPSGGNIVGSRTGRPTGETIQGGSAHRVAGGETLSQIARYYGLTVGQMTSFNGISNPNLIYAGQILKIPEAGYQPQRTVSTSGASVVGEQVTDSQTRENFQSVVSQDNPEERNYLLYTFKPSDNIASLEARFGLKPGSILMANPQLRELGGVPVPGMTLRISERTLELPARDEAVGKLIEESNVVAVPIITETHLFDYVEPGVQYDAVLALNPDLEIDGEGHLAAGQTIIVPESNQISKQDTHDNEDSTLESSQEATSQSLNSVETGVEGELTLTNGIAAQTTTLVKDEAGKVVRGQDGRVLTQESTLLVPEGSNVKVVGEVVDPKTGEKMILIKLQEDVQKDVQKDVQDSDSGTELKDGQIFQVSPEWIFGQGQDGIQYSQTGGGYDAGIQGNRIVRISDEQFTKFKKTIDDGMSVKIESRGMILNINSEGFSKEQQLALAVGVQRVVDFYKETFGPSAYNGEIIVSNHNQNEWAEDTGVTSWAEAYAYENGNVFLKESVFDIGGGLVYSLGCEIAHYWGYPVLEGFTDPRGVPIGWDSIQEQSKNYAVDEALMARTAEVILEGDPCQTEYCSRNYQVEIASEFPGFYSKLRNWIEENNVTNLTQEQWIEVAEELYPGFITWWNSN